MVSRVNVRVFLMLLGFLVINVMTAFGTWERETVANRVPAKMPDVIHPCVIRKRESVTVILAMLGRNAKNAIGDITGRTRMNSVKNVTATCSGQARRVAREMFALVTRLRVSALVYRMSEESPVIDVRTDFGIWDRCVGA